MQSFENTVTIQRPTEEVFAFLADFENIPRWNYAIEETHKASAGPVGVGTSYRQTRSVPSRSVEGFEVTVFEPARRLAIWIVSAKLRHLACRPTQSEALIASFLGNQADDGHDHLSAAKNDGRKLLQLTVA